MLKSTFYNFSEIGFAENANYDEKITIINEHPLLRIGKDPLFVLICDSRVFSL